MNSNSYICFSVAITDGISIFITETVLFCLIFKFTNSQLVCFASQTRPEFNFQSFCLFLVIYIMQESITRSVYLVLGW